MNTDGHRWKKATRKSLLTVGICLFVYTISYALNSFFGGYWLVPERDGRDKYSFGLSITDAIMWQPRFGHEGLGNSDLVGIFYTPLIRLDRRFVHPTLHFLDKDYEQQFARLKVSQIHPLWRDGFNTKVTASVTRDESNKMLRCAFRYSGSDYPRVIVAIEMRRALADLLEVSPPSNFVETPYGGDVEFLRTNYTYWVGKLPLIKDEDVILEFPVKQPKAGKGSIIFFYQRTDNTNYSRNLCSIELK